jgi:hypothetical protein
MPEFVEWDSFYVIVGSTGGALIGLQFVVMTLIAERPPQGAKEATAAFASPTIVHFGTVFFLAAILRAPWHSIMPVSVLWGLVGVGGVLYTVMVSRRMVRQSAYQPEFEDWVFHGVLPFIAYAAIAATALCATSHIQEALFGVGGALLLLLFSGIHNAWDGVAYHVLVNRRSEKV